MKKIIEMIKNVVITLAGCVRLLLSIYFHAVFFLVAVIINKLMHELGSKVTLEEMLNNLEYAMRTRISYYREKVYGYKDHYLKDVKLPDFLNRFN